MMCAARARARLIVAAVACCAGGCAGPPPLPSVKVSPIVVPARSDDLVPGPSAGALANFERQQRDTADAAARRGRWAEAIWAWDVVLALTPHDAEAASQRAKAEEARRAALPERMARARADWSRGDLDAAARSYLEVLALAPDETTAADGLREIERERVRRYQLGLPSRTVMARRTPSGNTARGPTVEERNEIEHASMLAGEGEINAAITILQPLAGPRRGSPTLRALLADLYLRQAERLVATDRAGAIAALELGLQADPGHRRLLQQLRQLRSTPPAAPKVAR